LKYKKLNVCDSPDDGRGGPKHVVKRGSEKCQNKHSVAIAGIDLCHIYIYIYIYILGNKELERKLKDAICYC
jgi:hypothetical protein